MRTHRQAFTLVEVVLAISLTLGLIGAALSFNHYVQTVKNDVLSDVEASTAQQRAMELMTCELRSAMVPMLSRPGAPPLFGMVGSNNEVAFLSTLVPGASAWLPPEQHTAEMPVQGDVQRVMYRIRYSEEGAASNDGLERISQSALAADDDRSPAMVDLVAPGVHFLRLRYHVGDPASGQFSGVSDNGWVDTWQGALPLAVEVTMGQNPLGEGQDVNEYLASNETFRRVVYLPGTTIEPLGSGGGGLQ